MRILVTGGCGFIGSNFIIEQISSTDNSILNIDKLTYAGNPENLISIIDNPKYNFAKIDITNLTSLSKVIFKFKPNVVVHFAAESHVDRSIDSPMTFINTNIVGTANLLEASFQYSKNKNFKFIHISTDEVFGSTKLKNGFTEVSPYNPSSPYSASKASSDHLVRAWTRTYDFPAVITNCSNNYGPFQYPEKLIPLMIANCIDNKTLPVYGDGKNIRDWLHVKDHCNAINYIIKNGIIGESYNIGGNNQIENIDIVTKICNIMNELRPLKNNRSYESLISYVPDRPGHDFRYAIDSSKIKKELKWLPTENFETGIRKTIQWYLNNEDWWRNIIEKIKVLKD